jgi:hypothetical protein
VLVSYDLEHFGFGIGRRIYLSLVIDEICIVYYWLWRHSQLLFIEEVWLEPNIE